jgi:hypothetical protein
MSERRFRGQELNVYYCWLQLSAVNGMEIKIRLRLFAGLKWTQKVSGRTNWRFQE